MFNNELRELVLLQQKKIEALELEIKNMKNDIKRIDQTKHWTVEAPRPIPTMPPAPFSADIDYSKISIEIGERKWIKGNRLSYVVMIDNKQCRYYPAEDPKDKDHHLGYLWVDQSIKDKYSINRLTDIVRAKYVGLNEENMKDFYTGKSKYENLYTCLSNKTYLDLEAK